MDCSPPYPAKNIAILRSDTNIRLITEFSATGPNKTIVCQMPVRDNISLTLFGISRTNDLTIQVQGAGRIGSSTGVCPFSLKCRGIPDSAMDAVERPGNKGAYHEHFIPAGKRRVDPQGRCRGKPEPRVIGRVPDHNNDPVPQLPGRP